MRKEILARTALAAGGLLAGLMLSEFLLAAFDLPRFYRLPVLPQAQFKLKRYGSGDGVFYTNYPSDATRLVYDGDPRGYFGPDNAVIHTSNSSGLRGPEFLVLRTPGVFRLAFLGDSFTYGQGVKDGDNYPDLTGRLLAEKYGFRFEAYNFGVGGYNAADSLRMLENVVMRLRPDAVVLGLAVNDAEPPMFHYDAAADAFVREDREARVPVTLSPGHPPSSFKYRFRLPRLLWQLRRNRLLAARTEKYYRELYREGAPGWKDMRESLDRFGAVCAKAKTHCLFAQFPLFYKLGADYPFKDIHAMIKEAATAPGREYVHYIDLLPRYAGKKDTDLWVHPTDQHPNEAAHLIAAQAIVAALPEFRYRQEAGRERKKR